MDVGKQLAHDYFMSLGLEGDAKKALSGKGFKVTAQAFQDAYDKGKQEA